MKKDKTQISVRIADNLMDAVNEHTRQTGKRMADLIEHGLILAMAEECKLSPLAKQVRFMAANLTKKEEDILRNFMVWLALPDLPGYEMPPDVKLARSIIMQIGEYAEQQEGWADKALSVYAARHAKRTLHNKEKAHGS